MIRVDREIVQFKNAARKLNRFQLVMPASPPPNCRRPAGILTRAISAPASAQRALQQTSPRCRHVARNSKRSVQDGGSEVSFFCFQLKIFAMPSRKTAASTTNNDSSLSSRSSRSAARAQPPASPPASPAKSIAKSTKRYALFHCISLPFV